MAKERSIIKTMETVKRLPDVDLMALLHVTKRLAERGDQDTDTVILKAARETGCANAIAAAERMVKRS